MRKPTLKPRSVEQEVEEAKDGVFLLMVKLGSSMRGGNGRDCDCGFLARDGWNVEHLHTK